MDTSGYNWLKFSMDEDEQLGLVKAGARTALDFLERFDWGGYKRLLTALAAAQQPPPATPVGDGDKPAAQG